MGTAEPQLNNYDTARRIVHNCQVIRKKNSRVKTIKKGRGHMFNFPETSNNRVYKSVYRDAEPKPAYYQNNFLPNDRVIE